MNDDPPEKKSSQTSEELVENVVPHLSWLRHPLAWHRDRQLKRIRQANNQRLAWQVQDILVGCGLFQTGSSIVGGYHFYVPHVVSVDLGPPERLEIHILPGQIPDDYAAHTRRITYSLGVANVQVIPLDEPNMILLELRRRCPTQLLTHTRPPRS